MVAQKQLAVLTRKNRAETIFQHLDERHVFEIALCPHFDTQRWLSQHSLSTAVDL